MNIFQRSEHPIVYGCDPAVYHAIGKDIERGKPEYVMSQSSLREFGQCPRKWLFGSPKDDTRALRWGSVNDCLWLTPERFTDAYAVVPKTYTTKRMKCPKCGSETDSAKCAKCKVERVETDVEMDWNANSKTCEEWLAAREAEGKEVIKESDLSESRKALKRLEGEHDIAEIRAASKTQVAIRAEYHDEETGLIIPMKFLIDLLPEPSSDYGDTVFDFKTTVSAEANQWTRHAYAFGLHYQGAAYLDAVNAATGLKYRQFGHIIQESKEPYEPTIRPMSDDFITLGRHSLLSDLKHYCRCLKRGWFNGYDRAPIEPLSYMLQ